MVIGAVTGSSSRMLLAQFTSPLRSSLRNSGRAINASRRGLHSLPALPANLKDGEGCEPLFSQQTVRLLWDDWHAGLLNKLNDEVRGTVWENSSIVETVIGTSQDPTKIQAFNYASMALNNSFFLSGLKAKQMPEGIQHWSELPPKKPGKSLLTQIENHFESLPAFKLAFSSAAYGMAGSGYVWLVQDREQNLGIIPTFGAGTILVQNRLQRDGGGHAAWFEASSVESKPSKKEGYFISRTTDAQGSPFDPRSNAGNRPPQVRSFSSAPSRSNSDSVGEELFPLLCVSVHERDWLPDYGMWGKEEYLMRFWECVDWERVFRLHEEYKVKG